MAMNISKIVVGSITADKIAAGSVTAEKIAMPVGVTILEYMHGMKIMAPNRIMSIEEASSAVRTVERIVSHQELERLGMSRKTVSNQLPPGMGGSGGSTVILERGALGQQGIPVEEPIRAVSPVVTVMPLARPNGMSPQGWAMELATRVRKLPTTVRGRFHAKQMELERALIEEFERETRP